jgi:nitrate/TMAO reductase-like tetraheme cytochrome c subunit
MSKKFIQLFFVALVAVGLLALTQITQAQSVSPAANPTPAPLGRPDYNYSESNGCTSCHFSRGAGGDHMPEAVGMTFDAATNAFVFTGGGWRASVHAQSNFKSTQNTYCAKCHAPLQADPAARFAIGASKPIVDGVVEGVTCAVCHPSHNAAVVLGRRLGIYKWGMDKTTAAAYDVVKEGNEDLLCLNCHTNRHNEGNPAFDLMYVAGVRCIDCHMAVNGEIAGTDVPKRAHDFKVAKNLPYSCGVEGSIIHCHPEFSVEATNAFIPYMKEQHRTMWVPDKTTKKLRSAADYLKLWKSLEAQVQK